MSRLFTSFEFLNRGWDVRLSENQSLRSVFIVLLVDLFMLGMITFMMIYEGFRLHRFDWSNAILFSGFHSACLSLLSTYLSTSRSLIGSQALHSKSSAFTNFAVTGILKVLTVAHAGKPRDCVMTQPSPPMSNVLRTSTNEVPSLWSGNRSQHCRTRGPRLLVPYPMREMRQGISDRGGRSDD